MRRIGWLIGESGLVKGGRETGGRAKPGELRVIQILTRRSLSMLQLLREANMRFAEVVNSFVGAGDMVWVQDYHREFPIREGVTPI